MRQAVSPSADRVYGLARVARCGDVSRATVYRHRQAPAVPKRRPGPVGPGDNATAIGGFLRLSGTKRTTLHPDQRRPPQQHEGRQVAVDLSEVDR